MNIAIVQHPEVDERLYVHECVVRVACPQCKMKAGKPCKGARFDWIARGSRRGFRYTQDAHYSRRELFQAWKCAGRPARYPADVYARFETKHGSFPKKIDRNTLMPELERRQSGSRKRRERKQSFLDSARAPLVHIEHKGCIWEGIEGNQLWSWMPYIEYGNFTHISVFDFSSHLGGVRLRFEGHEHSCESCEDAFDLAIELVVKAALLAVFNERSEWRVRELERRFGDRLSEGEAG